MDCTKFHEMISLYIDEETSSVQSQALEKHIETCSGCKSSLASQLKLRDMVRESYVKAVDIDLSSSIMSKINTPVSVTKKSSNMKRISMFIAAAAAVCVLAMAALMSLHVDNDTIAGNEKLEEYVIEHVGSGSSDFNGELETVNIEK